MGFEASFSKGEADKINKMFTSLDELMTKADDAYLQHALANRKKLSEAVVDQMNAERDRRLAEEAEINLKLIEMGLDANSVLLEDRLKTLAEEEAAELKNAVGVDKLRIKKKYEAERNNIKLLAKDADKVAAAREKAEKERAKKNAKDMKNMAKSVYGNLGNMMFDVGGQHREELKEQLIKKYGKKNVTDETVNKALKDAKGQAVFDALAGFAKQLESQVNDIANAQASIDTRLQGSSGRKWEGSYWKAMSQDIIKNVGMSPLVKQADVVTNLKTLVGKGISYNVEQRAFLDTISAKIADTFEATDGTLLKLVRIQQQDTTAARLGMESALTAFLNNMYETTEYMTEAASEIRQNLYEASALMGGASATAFEYQVQKWMGSLYSVGFGNTSGLSAALGKLAAGDLSSITDGGYGNLLVTAANKANLSIAEILADGLDDSSTNKLMQAMVEYLGGIYNETKNSKVVAQQFANVYGLSASDLKAAANLAGSTKNIARNNLNYNGMMAQLNNMANSMWQRTSSGEMMTNLFDNLKYATASTLANSPALYATYTLAGMLQDTTGGIALPDIKVMGSGVNLQTTVADLMRVGALSGGILGGIGNMLAGLGNNGTASGMMRGFGVGTNTTVSRGTGTGLLTTSSGATVSNSGYVGNSEGSDVQNKTLTDANDSANEQFVEAQEETTETKLSTVDEHLVNLYNLFRDVVDGTSSLHVDMGNSSAWSAAFRTN